MSILRIRFVRHIVETLVINESQSKVNLVSGFSIPILLIAFHKLL